jgi:hypothetical protein
LVCYGYECLRKHPTVDSQPLEVHSKTSSFACNTIASSDSYRINWQQRPLSKVSRVSWCDINSIEGVVFQGTWCEGELQTRLHMRAFAADTALHCTALHCTALSRQQRRFSCTTWPTWARHCYRGCWCCRLRNRGGEGRPSVTHRWGTHQFTAIEEDRGRSGLYVKCRHICMSSVGP